MIKVKHIGIKLVNVNVFGNIQNWNKDEVREVSEDIAIKLTENPKFIIVKEEVIEDIKENVIEKPIKKKKVGFIGGN